MTKVGPSKFAMVEDDIADDDLPVKIVVVSHVTDGDVTTVHLRGCDQHGNQVEETLTLGSKAVTSKHAYYSLGHLEENMGESIENKTLREMIADRDRALNSKEKVILDLRSQIMKIQGDLQRAKY